MKIIITESQYNFLVESQEVVDRILDKISERGYESLSIDEKKYLDHFSKHEGNPDELNLYLMMKKLREIKLYYTEPLSSEINHIGVF
jgi:hypothetical protein